MSRHRERDGARTLRVDVGRLAALVPVAVLVACTAAVAADSRQDQASASPLVDTQGLPAVPSTPVTEPGSVTVPDVFGGATDDSRTPATHAPLPGSGSAVVQSAAGGSGGPGIPARALQAYRHAERLLGVADPECRLDWPLIAAIGHVESRHGSFGGNVLDEAGVARPGIIGIALDGSRGTARIGDSDGGAFDRDTVYDRAVGPMQFIPGTWRMVGADAEPDGRRDPQDIDDAAAAAGIYLCSGTGDLSKSSDRYAAVYRYNHSDAYVRQVLAIADSYARGVTELPDGVRAAGRSGDVRALAAPGGRNVDGDTRRGSSAEDSRGAGGSSDGQGGPSGPVMTPVPPPSKNSGSQPGASPSGSSKPPASGGQPVPVPTTTSGAGGAVGGVVSSAGGAVGGVVGGVTGALPGAPAPTPSATSTTTSGSASPTASEPTTSPTCVNLLGIRILCP
jgi:membrane-bound lytic murein transglycosylase B